MEMSLLLVAGGGADVGGVDPYHKNEKIFFIRGRPFVMYIYGAKTQEEALLAEHALAAFADEDYEKAYNIALECPCMTWLIKIYEKLNGDNDIYQVLEEAANQGVFYAHGLAMTYISLDCIPREMTEIAAEQGCPLSQCIMYEKTGNSMWAQMAADQNFRDGLYLLGKIYEAAELGHLKAIRECANNSNGQEQWYWICKLWKLEATDHEFYFLDYYQCSDHDALCQIGALLPKCDHARTVYLEHCKLLRAQIDMWSLCAKRAGVCKDIRVLVGKMVWSKRVYRPSL